MGSYVAERYARQGGEILVLDDLSRGRTLRSSPQDPGALEHNWRFLEGLGGVRLERGSVADAERVADLAQGCDVIVHAAA